MYSTELNEGGAPAPYAPGGGPWPGVGLAGICRTAPRIWRNPSCQAEVHRFKKAAGRAEVASKRTLDECGA